MKKVPDLVFVIDTNYESLAIAESSKLGIPIIAILDSNSNPEKIDYPIPGNDDAIRSINLYANYFRSTLSDAKDISKDANVEKINEEIASEKEILTDKDNLKIKEN